MTTKIQPSFTVSSFPYRILRDSTIKSRYIRNLHTCMHIVLEILRYKIIFRNLYVQCSFACMTQK